VIRAGGVQVGVTSCSRRFSFTSTLLYQCASWLISAKYAVCLYFSDSLPQGGVSKALASPKPMFIQTGVQLTVSAQNGTMFSMGFGSVYNIRFSHAKFR
jgi:hypothetical protein